MYIIYGPGSGITIYLVQRDSVYVNFSLDGDQPTSYQYDDSAQECIMNNQGGCFNTSAYDRQSLPYGNHSLALTVLTPTVAHIHAAYSDFFFDYAVANDTQTPAANNTQIPSRLTSPQ
jgi:hypothetical protein